jgi:rubrerythrin
MEGMDVYSIGEVLEQAIQTEKLGYELYIEMARRFEKDEQLKKLFETLAAKEHEHEKTFVSMKDTVGTGKVENWEEASRYLRAIVESEFFLGKNKSLPSLDHLKNIDDAVKYAIGFEKETLLYYLGLRDLVKEKDMVNRLIKEEKSHLVWLGDYRKKINK